MKINDPISNKVKLIIYLQNYIDQEAIQKFINEIQHRHYSGFKDAYERAIWNIKNEPESLISCMFIWDDREYWLKISYKYKSILWIKQQHENNRIQS